MEQDGQKNTSQEREEVIKERVSQADDDVNIKQLKSELHMIKNAMRNLEHSG